jgi:hypothetical protein
MKVNTKNEHHSFLSHIYYFYCDGHVVYFKFMYVHRCLFINILFLIFNAQHKIYPELFFLFLY